MIFYFSGTGNTKFVAEYLAEALDDELAAMADVIRNGGTLRATSEKPYVFLAPIYAWRFPRAVEDSIRSAELSGSRAVYCIATRESQSGVAAEYMRRIVEGKGLDFKGFTSVDMPNQYLLSSPVSTPEQTRAYLKQVLPQLKALAEKIRRGETLTDDGNVALPHLMSGLVNAASYRFMITSKNFAVSDACIGCGACAKRCPMGNIEMKDGKPTFGGKCTWCFSCIQYCPKAAIDIKGRTEGQPRYVCPEYRVYMKGAMIFEETQIGSMTLKNRVLRAAIGDHDADETGHYGEKDFEGYEKVAKGSVGTIITGYSYVADYPMGGKARMLGAYSDDFVPEYRRLTDMVHYHGCNILQQLVHIGAATACEGVDIIGPSAGAGPYNGQPCREMTPEDIDRVERSFADAAVRAKRAGFDGVEVHAAHKFLLSQFLSPAYNRRTDAYGGSDENRARFAAEVCGKIRAAVGAEYPVFFKVNCDDGVENGITLDGLLAACKLLEAAGASALEISGAWMNYKQDTPYFLEQTITAAKTVQIPVILVGGVRRKDTVERILAETPIRYVSMARPFVAKPDLMMEWNAQ